MYTKTLALLALMATVLPVGAREFHVSVDGDDMGDGSASSMLRTISAAAERAQPGDVITVHEGIYRERVSPPRGGTSDDRRIVYQAAPGEKVVIKGSEEVKGWERVGHDTWKVTLPDTFFGTFNPFKDLIAGDWFRPNDRVHHTGAVYLDGHWLTEAARREEVMAPAGRNPLWFTEEAEAGTTIWAQFPGIDPNRANVEINARQTVFYPEQPGMNYITLRGFTLEHAATPWAPPTAEQIGLVGTHWSKGWIIEDNTIRYSICTGVTLGKYGDEWDNRSNQSADGYNRTIRLALENGWSKANIGHHVVRNNHISHCEQAGIVGSLGPVFCTVTGNEIHDIHVRRLFSGAEMAAIKFHAPIDTVISGNHIYRSFRGIWLDWMAQGSRVTRNLLHGNGEGRDLYVEVNHGPFLVDNNIFLSGYFLLDLSQGGAYVHNLAAGRVRSRPERNRATPFHKPHSTDLAGVANIRGGDDRFYNNIFIKPVTLVPYNKAAQRVWMAGNVFLKGARAPRWERAPLVRASFNPIAQLREEPDGVYLKFRFDQTWASARTRRLVTTDLLGKAKIPDMAFEQPDGSPYRLDTDYFGKPRNPNNPFPGPFEWPEGGTQELKVWPVARP